MPYTTKDIDQCKHGLGTRVVRGTSWLAILKLGTRAVSLVSTMILARVLSPADFGVLCIGLITIAFFETISQSGFEAALVQKKETIDYYLDTAWCVSVARGLLLCLMLFLLAPIVGRFFNSTEAINVLRVLALCPLLSGFKNVGMVFFQKKLDFKKIFFWNIGGSVAYSMVAISLALILKNVWAMVYATLANRITILILSYVLHPYRPRLTFSPSKAKELFHFGKWILANSITVFLINRGHNAFVGRMLGITALGFYDLAHRISLLFAAEISRLISQVMFPAYSQVQHDFHKLKRASLKTLEMLGFFCVPAAGMIFVFAPEFTKLFLGDKWLPSVPIVQIFSLVALINSIASPTGSFFKGIGKPKIATQLLLARLAILGAFIYPLSARWNAMGAATATLIATSVVDPVATLYFLKLSGNTVRDGLNTLLIPTVNTVLMVLLVSVLKDPIIEPYGIPGFFALGLISVLFYWILSFVSEKLFAYTSFFYLRQILHEAVFASGENR